MITGECSEHLTEMWVVFLKLITITNVWGVRIENETMGYILYKIEHNFN